MLFSSVQRSAVGLVLTLATLAGFGSQALAQSTNRLESIQAQSTAGDKVELTLRLAENAPTPLTFTVDNPARIALDLPATSVAMTSRRVDVKQGVLDTVNVAEANGRTRVVLNVDTLVPYETRVEGNTIIVSLAAAGTGRSLQSSAAPGGLAAATQRAPSAATVSGVRSVNNIDFRRSGDGAARVIVELTDSKVPADLRQEGGKIVVNFAKTAIPENLLQRLDVVDFATPVSTVDALRVGDGTRIVIAASGDYEQLAYQSDNIYTIEVKPVVKLPPELREKKEYAGERLTLNFQDIDTRAVLQLLADTSGQNMVISDSVAGNVTLRLQNVPWDQALDVVMRTKGLDSRQEGNVIFIAPANEIAAREKELLTARKEAQELSPLRTEYLQVNYAKAADLAALIKSGAGSLISERGSVAIDERTNTLLLQDTSERLADIRRLVSTLDIPVKQVMIEARIVIVSDDYSRDLGVRFGANVAFTQGGSDGLGLLGGALNSENGTTISPFPSVAGSTDNDGDGINDPIGTPTAGSSGQLGGFGLPESAADRYLVNLPASNPAGRIALALLDSDYLVDLELSAAQAEGRGEIISSPRLITANQREATIEQGVEIPYQESSSSGATTTQFKKAVLSLKVTPQITPDNRVILDLTVSKDSVGQLVASATGGFVPSIDTREIITQVLVNDGQTVVLGGILETERRDAENKVPYLGDIPVLGRLFKQTTTTDNKDELLIFVTPRILREGSSLY
ncbi:type IV pilus secretin PilQ [Steroidobacter sp.]|uniref:type IV pilus secretin PilQ n=1 Tax=Steroidobacter sp. TaxID=1978227 RepID=UPI001A44F526|nr:type IV pilus secretin PilQ [Steroidobacter sp.]MBL8271828.1 type IV pilus secretin PilQ [Steroidobacter sp.]